MPSAYSTDFRIQLMADGEQSGLWGSITNTNWNLYEQSVAGVLAKSVAGSTDVTLTATNGASDESRNRVYQFTGALTGSISTIQPAANQLKTVYNNTTGAFTLTHKGVTGTGVVIPQGYYRQTYFDGTNVVDMDPFGYDGPYATLASATTTDLSTIPSANVNITGTTTITAFGTLPAGVRKFLRFSGACPITYNATSMIIRQGAASVTLDAGATAVAISLGAGNWELDNIQFGGVGPFDRRSPGAIGATTPAAATFLTAVAPILALTDAATVAWDMALGNNASVTLGGNRTLGLPTNLTAGQGGSLFVTQDATGSRTLSYNAAWKFAGGTVPTLTTTASAVDRLDYLVKDSTHIHAALSKDVK